MAAMITPPRAQGLGSRVRRIQSPHRHRPDSEIVTATAVTPATAPAPLTLEASISIRYRTGDRHIMRPRQRQAPDSLPRITSTTYERQSLGRAINLSDAHCRQSLSPSQLTIVERLPELFHEARTAPHREQEEAFLTAFMNLSGEPVIGNLSRYLFSYSASCAITMVTSHCARFGKRVALIEPVFDSIPSTLHRENVEVVSLPECDCTVDRLPAALARLDPAVVWLVTPNNPTGRVLSEPEFRTLVELCGERHCTLVLDSAFRFFTTGPDDWSKYRILEDSGVSYVVLEDTGKTWPANEMKVGLTVCSEDMYPDLSRLHDDLLQSVSPFHLRVLREFIEDSARHGIQNTVLPLMRNNRAILRSVLAGDVFRFVTEPDSAIPVDWVHLADCLDCETLAQETIRNGVHVLPGINFFWSQPERGRQFLRIALARDPELVQRGAEILGQAADRLATAGRAVCAGE